MMYVNLYVIKDQLLAYEINYLPSVTQPTKALLTRTHSPTLGSKIANIKCKKTYQFKTRCKDDVMTGKFFYIYHTYMRIYHWPLGPCPPLNCEKSRIWTKMQP